MLFLILQETSSAIVQIFPKVMIHATYVCIKWFSAIVVIMLSPRMRLFKSEFFLVESEIFHPVCVKFVSVKSNSDGVFNKKQTTKLIFRRNILATRQ